MGGGGFLSETEFPTLAIVVVTFNASKFIHKTARSIAEQRFGTSRAIEILLIDGCSSDDTVEIAEKSGVFTQIVVEPDSGIYDAMNKGARLAKAEWLHFLNAGDTFYDNRSLDVLVDDLERSRAAWAVSRAMNLGGGSGPARTIPSVPHRWYRHALGLQPHCHQATYFRRSTFLEVGGHSLRYGMAGDFDIIMRLGMMQPPHEIDRTLINYLGGGVSHGAWRLNGDGQHLSRTDRMQYGRTLRNVDAMWVRLSQVLLRARVAGGRYRSLARRVVR